MYWDKQQDQRRENKTNASPSLDSEDGADNNGEALVLVVVVVKERAGVEDVGWATDSSFSPNPISLLTH